MFSRTAAVLWGFIAGITLLALIFLLFTPSAGATTSDPSLDRLASIFAMRPVTVKCYERDEVDSPWSYDAWGYVYKPTGKAKYTAIDLRICQGALGINDESLPDWQRALGIAVIVHEAYHLRRWGANQDEGRVECKSIRHWKVAARLAGATEETVKDLWGDALAAHYRIAAFKDMWGNRPYYYKDCVVPPYLSDEDLDG